MNTQQPYSTLSLPIVVDAWPNGSAFGSADVWEHHTLAPNEGERLDHLVGLALLDSSVCNRLIVQRDPSLLDAFNLADDTRQWLATVQARTLEELAQAIVAASNPYRR